MTRKDDSPGIGDSGIPKSNAWWSRVQASVLAWTRRTKKVPDDYVIVEGLAAFRVVGGVLNWARSRTRLTCVVLQGDPFRVAAPWSDVVGLGLIWPGVPFHAKLKV